MTDAFVSEVTGSIRRSLFHRLKAFGFSQDELTGIVAGATREAVRRAQVADLAAITRAAGPVAAALETAAPDDPALAAFAAARVAVDPAVSDLLVVSP